MDIAHVLRDILVVLVAAKVAAELAERIGVPAVVAEIVAGILVGPSLLGLVGEADEVLRTLGEIGVILLLLEVGLEMDLVELGKVGRASLLVATVGVVTPLVLGTGTMVLIGDDFKTALFIGAALTATSVGITARVFGDLRALATTEARIVLGAAVADDVMGLMVLTVVVRLVTEGSVSAVSVTGILIVAVAFLVLGGLVGLRVAPPLFDLVERASRSTGTLVALALAFTLGFAELADVAQLAPIVGAFVAGIALSRSAQAERIGRELAPVGHLFIPVFFLQIGIDAKIEAFGRGAVLRDAALLLAVAVVGKLVSPLGAWGAAGDKPLIGLGMLPRGEVGLIFATIGLQNGVLDDDLYAALLLVVLVTTLTTPQLLKLRYSKLRRRAREAAVAVDHTPPPGGWLVVADGEVGLRARPPGTLALPIGLEAAVAVGRSRPSNELLDWLASLPDEDTAEWDDESRDRLLDAIERGNARSWRFLETTGILDRALPELAEALRRRQADPFTVDPVHTHRLHSMDRLRRLDPDDPVVAELRLLPDIDWLLLGAFLAEGLEDARDPAAAARRIARRLLLSPVAEEFAVALVADRDLLWSAARQQGALEEDAVVQLASHLGSRERARALYVLSELRAEGRERWEVMRLRQLYELIQAALANPALTGTDTRSLLDLRRLEAAELVAGDADATARVAAAPASYVLRQPSERIATLARMLDPAPASADVRVAVNDADGGSWWLDIAARDRPGLLATVTSVLAGVDLDVREAVVATWPDGAAVESFRVPSAAPPDRMAIQARIQSAFDAPLHSVPLPDAVVTFDGAASPWHTVCEVRSLDEPGVLHSLAAAFAAAGVNVLSASASSDDEMVIDRFEVTDQKGAKVNDDRAELVRQFIRTGVSARRRRFGRTFVTRS